MTCDAIWVVDHKKIEVRPTTVPEPRYDEVQIETKACGVCCWDAFQFQGISGPGPYPYMIGHEAVGIVCKVGEDVKGWKPGDKVFCASGSIVEMAQYFNIRQDCISRIPDDTQDYAKYVIEPTATVLNVLSWAGIEPGDHVALVGAGYMGLITLMGLRAYPYGKLTVFEKQPVRMALARKYGAERVYDPESDEGLAAIDAIVAEGGADTVIEFSASDDGFALANAITRQKAGKLTIGSWHRHDMTFEGTQWHMTGRIVNNISPSSTRHYEDMIPRTAALVERGIFTPWDLITHVADYRDCQAVFERSVDKKDGYIKGVITF